MPEPVDLKFALRRPPRKAIAYFRSKGYTFTWDWFELWQDAHARAFTVAKAMKLYILQDIRQAIEAALEEGKTFRQFQREIEPILRQKGWWGKVKARDVPGFDPASGEDPDRVVQLGSPWRLRTIYRVNVNTAYQVGRYKAQMSNAAARPWWMYVAVLDSRTRPSHRQIHGKVFRFDDPFWDFFYPPNGWNCRCRVRALSDARLRQMKIEPQNSRGKISQDEEVVNQRTGESRPVAVYSDFGIRFKTDAGWSYNPGKTGFEPDLNQYDEDLRRAYRAEKDRNPPTR